MVRAGAWIVAAWLLGAARSGAADTVVSGSVGVGLGARLAVYDGTPGLAESSSESHGALVFSAGGCVGTTVSRTLALGIGLDVMHVGGDVPDVYLVDDRLQLDVTARAMWRGPTRFTLGVGLGLAVFDGGEVMNSGFMGAGGPMVEASIGRALAPRLAFELEARAGVLFREDLRYSLALVLAAVRFGLL